MEKIDVLVVGGSAAGIVAATTAKSFYSDKDVTLIRKEKDSLVPCGIPYVFGTLDSSDQNCAPDAGLANAGVTLKIDEVVSIDPENKICKTAGGTEIGFEKLVLATGSTPTKPSWLKGTDLENVFTIPKDKIYLDNFKICLDAFKKVVVIGGGFIGVEMADELAKSGKDVTLVEMMPHVLAMAFDEELALKAQEVLQSRGVKIKTGSGVKEINGNGKVTGITLNDDETIEADAVILS
nr:FAD/NAD(P)-binding oxidoreductase [Desulfobacteraceae bacterium]